jgi:AmmeMemoRadiSam system protein B
MSTVRPPAVAGMFYPANPNELRREIRDFLAQAEKPPEGSPVPKAIIAPHAGYVYSGPVAASAYARLQPAKDRIHRVVLFGPSHRVPFMGLATTSATHFHTPLGDIPIDTVAVESIIDLPQVKQLEQAHSLEHSLEVHLPFLQMVLDDFTLVPLVAGEASPEQIAEVLEALWGGPETVIVISSDLSHYHDYATAQRMDSATSRAIEMLQLEDVDGDHACGRVPVNGLLYYARTHGLHAETIDLRNSGDTAGPKDQVVGYGAYVFH